MSPISATANYIHDGDILSTDSSFQAIFTDITTLIALRDTRGRRSMPPVSAPKQQRPHAAFGAFVRNKRIEAGFKRQTDLAKAAGVAQPRISQWERGNVLPDSDNMKKLAPPLKVSVLDLWQVANPDLLRHRGVGQSDLQQHEAGGDGVLSAASMEIEILRSALGQAQKAAESIAINIRSILGEPEVETPAAPTPSKRAVGRSVDRPAHKSSKRKD